MSEEMLRKVAEKLGVFSTKAIRKSLEYYRLCSARSTLGLSNVSDSAKLCFVLHIAAEELSLPFDKAQAIKLSCLTKPAYLKLVHTFKSLACGDSSPTVSSLCADLRLPELTETASELLNSYESTQTQGLIDTNLPLYACAAVLAAAKLKRAAVDKDRLKENCRVKWTTCQKVSAEMVESAKARGGRKRKAGIEPSAVAAAIEKRSSVVPDALKPVADETPEDDYEAWKSRILQQANS